MSQSSFETTPPIPNADLAEEAFRESRRDRNIDVTRLHGAILREMDEPADGYEPIPMWMLGFLGAFAIFSGIYLGLYSGGFSPKQFFFTPITERGSTGPVGPPDPKVVGKKLFTANCVSCHQSTGLGQAGQFPPLAGSEWVTNDAPNRLVAILLHGLQGPVKVKGASYNGAMAAWESVFKDEQIAAILTYIRSDWGNDAPPITKEAVAAMREKTVARKGSPWTEAELLAMAPDSSILTLGGGAPPGAPAPAPGAPPPPAPAPPKK